MRATMAGAAVARAFRLPLRAPRGPGRLVVRAASAPLVVLLSSFLILLFVASPEIRSLAVQWAVAILGGFRSAWALLWIDTRGTAVALGMTFLKMLPGAVPVLVLIWRLRGWERV